MMKLQVSAAVSSKWAKGTGGPAGDEAYNLVAMPLKAKANSSHDDSHETYVTHALRSEGADASEDGTGRGTPLIVAAHETGQGWWNQSEIAGTIRAEGENRPSRPSNIVANCFNGYTGGADDNDAQGNHLIAFGWNKSDSQTMRIDEETTDALQSAPCSQPAIAWALHSQNSCAMTGNGEAQAAFEVDQVRALDGGAGFTASQGGNLVQQEIGPIAFGSRVARNGRGAPSGVVPPLKAESGQTGKGDSAPLTAGSFGVRRLTPRECERLQGFPDDWTLYDASGKEISDSARYRMLGNAVAVPVAQFIGTRIMKVGNSQ